MVIVYLLPLASTLKPLTAGIHLQFFNPASYLIGNIFSDVFIYFPQVPNTVTEHVWRFRHSPHRVRRQYIQISLAFLGDNIGYNREYPYYDFRALLVEFKQSSERSRLYDALFPSWALCTYLPGNFAEHCFLSCFSSSPTITAKKPFPISQMRFCPYIGVPAPSFANSFATSLPINPL